MDDLEKKVDELEVLTRRKKSNVAVLLNSNVDVPASELLAISQLEIRVANLRAAVRLRALTAEPSG